MTETTLYAVEIKLLGIPDKETAVALEDALTDAFMAHPKSSGIAATAAIHAMLTPDASDKLAAYLDDLTKDTP